MLDVAYHWLCQTRLSRGPNNDVWHCRFHWTELKPKLQTQLQTGDYMFSPLHQCVIEGEVVNSWCVQDALVLKAMSLVLSKVLAIDPHCYHVKGHGGMKKALKEAYEVFSPQHFFMRSDIKSYYAAIDHHVLMAQLSVEIKERAMQRLLWHYLQYTVTRGGSFQFNTRGIALRCPLSSLIGAFYLKPLDQALAKLKIRFWRVMDDWLILTNTRWQLRRAICTVNRVLEQLKLTKHPEKTQMGRCTQGITFLGYRLTSQGFTLATKTIHRNQARITRLYEQGASSKRIEQYRRHWFRWAHARLPRGTLTND